MTISDTAKGANIYYTLDGSVPAANSTLYTGPIAISKSTTLSAIAVATGFANSGVQSATYVIGQGVATPVIIPAGGTFNAATPVTITDATADATIYYTVDGSTPSSSSTPYIGSISVSTNETINAIAVTPNGGSSVATASFTISVPAAAPPTFSPAAGTFTSTQTVMLSDTTPSASIFYTVDGSMPTTSSQQYSGTGISVAASETIKTIATAPGFGASAVSSAAYTISGPVAPPTFSPAAGTYTSAQMVTLSDATSAATIYYTTDGTPVTTSSAQYNPSSQSSRFLLRQRRSMPSQPSAAPRARWLLPHTQSTLGRAIAYGDERNAAGQRSQGADVRGGTRRLRFERHVTDHHCGDHRLGWSLHPQTTTVLARPATLCTSLLRGQHRHRSR